MRKRPQTAVNGPKTGGVFVQFVQSIAKKIGVNTKIFIVPVKLMLCRVAFCAGISYNYVEAPKKCKQAAGSWTLPAALSEERSFQQQLLLRMQEYYTLFSPGRQGGLFRRTYPCACHRGAAGFVFAPPALCWEVFSGTALFCCLAQGNAHRQAPGGGPLGVPCCKEPRPRPGGWQ